MVFDLNLHDDYHLMFQVDVVDQINYLLILNFVNDLFDFVVVDLMKVDLYLINELLLMVIIHCLMNYLNLDQMLNDVNYLLLMLINLHMNVYELELMLMIVLMNQQVYNEYHVNINLTILVNLEQKMMDKESFFKTK